MSNSTLTSIPTPRRFFLSAGASEGYSPLNAFDAALLNAGVGDVNLVKLSSILPPNCEQVDPFEHQPGALTPVAYASMNSSLTGEIIAGAVACGVPVDDKLPGVIMEYSARGSAENAEEIVREMVRQAFEIRNRELKDILSVSIEHKIEQVGAVFAAVIFGY
ncbi:arginine decarboxylase, pyruvoyl-dependent [bacterium]|nr:arginine decarboxylase, pyruvoyl-dependent [bacterium]